MTTRGDRVADHETAAVSGGSESDGPAPSRADAIASIDDTIVRRLVRVAVHVRGYAPYYAATLALFGFLAFGPRPESKGGDDAAFGSSATSAAGGGAGATGGSGGRSAVSSPTTLSPQAAGTLLAGAAGLDGSGLGLDGDGGTFGIAGDASAGAGTALPEAPAAPDFESFDPGDVDYGTELPDACTVALPSPAPSVSPSREVDGLQTTLEAAAGTEAPADLAPYAEDAASTAGCPDASELPVPLPALPGLPV